MMLSIYYYMINTCVNREDNTKTSNHTIRVTRCQDYPL